MTTETNEADHAVIRKAGKATAVLQFFAVGLAVVLGTIYYDISNRYTAMQSGIRENAMWSVYQLDREARSLNNQLSVMLATADLDMASQKQLAMRYDILYSRMDMLAKAKFERFFAVDAFVAGQLTAIQQSVFGQVGLFDDISGGIPASRARLVIANASFKDLLRNTEQLVTYTNTELNTDRAEQREQVAALETKSLILIGFLVVIVGVIILTLRRQLRDVRAAGQSFERMAEKLRSAYQAAEAGNRAKSQFMATMSHEIRTPLNAILGTVELMELSPDDPDVPRNLKTIRQSGEALLDIINEILDFSKIEHGKLELELRSVDVRAMAESVMEMMRGRAHDSGNMLKLDMPADLAVPFVRTDATRLRQVIMNLMGNALKFTMGGEVTLGIRQLEGNGATVLRIEVRDTGIGIDEAGRAKLFLPFSQVDASIARRYGGTGLGLKICKEIVERLGGRIGVESMPANGSTFWFEVPAEPAAAPVVPAEISASPEAPLPRLKVLVVEDNPVNLRVATRFLVHLGQEVHSAENGAVAVERAAAEHFDLILMDMQMPVMDGIEATVRIRDGCGKSCRRPIIAMTANASDDDRKKCIEAGMDGFQSKPINVEKLRRIVDSVVVQGSAADTPIVVEPGARPPVTERKMPSPDFLAFESRRAELVEVLGEEDFSELMDSFFADARAALSDLARVVETGEVSGTDRLLHTMKGAAGNVGLLHVAQAAQRMRETDFDREALEKLTAVIDDCAEMLAA